MKSIARMQGSRLAALAPWGVAALAALVYANALRNGFALDDEGIVLRNPLMQDANGWWRAFTTPYWPIGAGQYRPLVIASFWSEWQLWGARPLGYHALNILWHALATGLVYAVARRWLSFGGSAIAAALFAVHPVHVEAVANVVGRSELMAAAGICAMLLLHSRRSLFALPAFAFALLSKEHALVALLLVVVADMADRADERAATGSAASGGAASAGRDADAATRRRARVLYAGYAALAIAWGIAVALVFRERPLAVSDVFWQTMDAPSRWLTALGAVVVWVRLWFFPFELSADYSPRVTLPWPENSPVAILGAAIVLAAVMLAMVAWRRDRVTSIAIVWLAIAMAPVANLFVTTGVIVAERTLYLSSIGAVLLGGHLVERIGVRRPALAVMVAVTLTVGFAARTWTRTPVWASNRSLLLTTARTHPHASWTHVLLARVYAGNGGMREASHEYRLALTLFDRSTIAWSEAIQTAAQSGDLALADSLVMEAERRVPGSYLVAVSHAHVALDGHRPSEALRAARRASVIAPDSATPRLLQGIAWAQLGHADSARAALARIPPRHPARARADSVLRVLRP